MRTLLCGLALAIPLCAQQAQDKTIVRVLSYNILHGATLKGDFDLDLIARVIKEVDPDVVALQEVDFKTERARGMDLATELGLRTRLAPLFGQAMPYDGGGYGLGVLSRYAFVSSRCHPLPYSPGNEPRAALQANIRLTSGEEFAFVSTHFQSHRDREKDRLDQAARINEIFSDCEIPAILAGDLNARPQSAPIMALLRHWTDASAGNPQPTMPSVNPQGRIDYVMFRPAHRWRVIESRVLEEEVASDHRPLLVVLELLPQD